MDEDADDTWRCDLPGCEARAQLGPDEDDEDQAAAPPRWLAVTIGRGTRMLPVERRYCGEKHFATDAGRPLPPPEPWPDLAEDGAKDALIGLVAGAVVLAVLASLGYGGFSLLRALIGLFS